jgi:hypothetical protein
MNYYENKEYTSVSDIKAYRNGYKIPDSPIFALGRAVEDIIQYGKTDELVDVKYANSIASAYKHREIILYNPDFQREYYVRRYGYKVRCKVDAINATRTIVEDIKTTSAAINHNSLMQAIQQFDYDMQAAAYMEITKVDVFIFTFLTKTKSPKCKQIPVTRTSPIFESGLKKWLSGLREINLFS